MARLPRIDVPGLPQHLWIRGNNRSILFTDDMDRSVFLKYLAEALGETACALHAYVLMTNHVHLLATGYGALDLSSMMHVTGTRFARVINRRRERTGTLFEGRFKSSLVQTERYFLTCMRYIEENPVRAGLAGRPADFHWSSHGQNATGEPRGLVTPHPEYLRLSPDASARGDCYRALFQDRLPEHELAFIRESAMRCRVLGDEVYRRRTARGNLSPNEPVPISPGGS
jgi:putative transposase